MSKLKVVPFEAQDAMLLKVRYELAKEEDLLDGFFRDHSFDTTRLFTFLSNDERIAVAGINLLRAGVGEIFMATSPDVQKCPTEFSKLCADTLIDIIQEWGLHRVEAYVREDFSTGVKWADFMGFKKEGLMQKFGSDKSNYILFARVY